MNADTLLQLTEREYFNFLINSRFFIDYGVVTKVTGNSMVDVVHAAIEVLLDDTPLPETKTPDVEVLWPASAGFSMQNEIAVGDQVLLIGLKSYVSAVAEVDGAKVPKSFDHYNRATLKAIPLCSFNADAGCVVKSTASKTTVDANALEINGDTKSFVTYEALNSALQGLVMVLASHTHNCTAPGSPSGPPLAALSLDISAAKTTTIKTGG